MSACAATVAISVSVQLSNLSDFVFSKLFLDFGPTALAAVVVLTTVPPVRVGGARVAVVIGAMEQGFGILKSAIIADTWLTVFNSGTGWILVPPPAAAAAGFGWTLLPG